MTFVLFNVYCFSKSLKFVSTDACFLLNEMLFKSDYTSRSFITYKDKTLFNKTVDCKMFFYMQIVFYQSMK